MIIVQNPVVDMLASFAATAIPAGTPGAVVPSTSFGLDLETVTLSATFNNYQFTEDNILTNPVSFENLTPTICNTSAWPLVTKVASGKGVIRLTSDRAKSVRTLDMTVVGGTTKTNIIGPAAGTFGKIQWDLLKALMDAGGELNLLDGGVIDGNGNWDFGAATYNPDCWAASLDFTGVAHKMSMWNTSHMAGTLVTSTVVRLAWHYQYPIGTVLTFISKDGTKYLRTVIAKNAGPSSASGLFNLNPMISDSCVAVLNEPLPTIATGATVDKAIKVYKVAGDWLYPAGVAPGTGVRRWFGVCLDQQRHVRLCGSVDNYEHPLGRQSGSYAEVTLTDRITGGLASLGQQWGGASLTFLTPYTNFFRTYAIVGDSGCPCFAIDDDGDPCLALTLTSGGMGGPHTDVEITNACIKSAYNSIGITTGIPTATEATMPA